MYVDGADHVGYSPIHPKLKPRAGTTHRVLAVRYAQEEEEVLERCGNRWWPLPGDRVVEVGFYYDEDDLQATAQRPLPEETHALVFVAEVLEDDPTGPHTADPSPLGGGEGGGVGAAARRGGIRAAIRALLLGGR